MIGLILLGFLFLALVGLAICGNVARIADAIEQQNRAYGVTDETNAPATETEPA